MNPNEAEKKFQQGVEQFNQHRFFEAHETWEEIWLDTTPPEKSFLQGLIQVAAAYHHYTRRNLRGTRTLLEAGLRKLEGFPTQHRGIRLEALRHAVRIWVETLAAGSHLAREQIPRIQRSKRGSAPRNPPDD